MLQISFFLGTSLKKTDLPASIPGPVRAASLLSVERSYGEKSSSTGKVLSYESSAKGTTLLTRGRIILSPAKVTLSSDSRTSEYVR